MSLAKVNQIKRVRKPGTCGKCGLEIKVGDPAVRFAVGFRGITRTRCTKVECFPLPSERESSLVSNVYAAQEEVDLNNATTMEDLEQIRDDVVSVLQEVAGEYEDSEMFERNPDLQERAEMLNSAADELESWEPEDEAPDEDGTHSSTASPGDDEVIWEYADIEYATLDEAQAAWLDDARESLRTAIDELELP